MSLLDEWISECDITKCPHVATSLDAVEQLHPLQTLVQLSNAIKTEESNISTTYMLTLHLFSKCVNKSMKTLLRSDFHLKTMDRCRIKETIDDARSKNIIQFKAKTLMNRFCEIKTMHERYPEVELADLVSSPDKYSVFCNSTCYQSSQFA